MPLPLVIVANAAVGKSWASQATGILAGVTAGITFLIGLGLAGGVIQAGPAGQAIGVDAGIMAAAVVAATMASKPVRERLARVIPIDPDNPVHAYAVVLVVIWLGMQLATIAFVDVLSSDQSLPPLTVGDVVASELPFLIMAVAGVGLFIRRDAAGVAGRLGLTGPAWWQIGVGLASAGAFFALIQAADALSHAWTPQLAHQVDRTTQHVFGALDNPVGIAVVALLPGICEEILFRGALQPRIGLLATAVLFASVHTQYGFSFDAVAIFVVAVGLGLLRKYTNTTTSCICHVSYNLLAGIGIASNLIGAAVAVEIALIGLSAYSVWSIRRRPRITASP